MLDMYGYHLAIKAFRYEITVVLCWYIFLSNEFTTHRYAICRWQFPIQVALFSLSHLPPGPNGRQFGNDIFRYIFIIGKFCISSRIPLKFVPMGPIDNRPALVQVMAWRLFGVKPLPEPKLTQFTDSYIRH